MMTSLPLDPRLCVAPMMDWTDRHCRFFLRQITRRTLLYTEMIPTGAILRGDQARFLRFDAVERPLAIQLGGSDPAALAECSAIAEAWGYDEVDLNVGCPSDRVQNARFGACLMADPDLVARCVSAMSGATRLPVTVKHRIGIDDMEGYEPLKRFVETVAAAGCRRFIVHARKAWLQGLSPKQNREIPPLRPDLVLRLKHEHPELQIVLNGAICDLDAATAVLAEVDGVMIGRAAYQDPWILAAADQRIFGLRTALPEREAVVREMRGYLRRQADEGVPVRAVTRHLMGLFNGQPGARRWRRHLGEASNRPGVGAEVLDEALEAYHFESRRQAA